MSKGWVKKKLPVPRRGPGRPPNPQKCEAHRRSFFESAFNLIASASYDQATVDQIVEGAGLSKGTFYWHFTGKEDCLLQAMERKVQEFEEMISKVLARRGFSCKQLEALARIEAWIDVDLPKMFFILGAMEHTQSHALRGFAHELRAKWFGQATRFLQEMGRVAAQEQGWSRRRIAAFDFRAWSHCWVASVEGLLVQNWTPPTGKFKPGRMSDVLRAVFIEPNFE